MEDEPGAETPEDEYESLAQDEREREALGDAHEERIRDHVRGLVESRTRVHSSMPPPHP